jgi:hypothetical protein
VLGAETLSVDDSKRAIGWQRDNPWPLARERFRWCRRE